MTLKRESWWPIATGLRPGERRRADHDCGPGHTLLVTEEGGRYRAWCFRCNEGDASAAPEPSPTERLARLVAARDADAERRRPVADLPEGLVSVPREWPSAARLWLYRAGLSDADIGALRAAFDPATGRVFLPVFEGGRCVFWQARALDGRQPKYLAPEVDRSAVLPRFGSAHAVTLTEDTLSAYKVGRVAEGWSLLGTRASVRLLTTLMQRRPPVSVWLDPDPPGQRAAQKIVRQLRGLGLETRNIISAKDPKLMTYEQIREKLCLPTPKPNSSS